MSQHPRLNLNPAFNNPLRFSIMAALSGTENMIFGELRDFVGTTDSNLSKHSSALEGLGYVQIKKGFVGKKPQTRLSLSKEGLNAWKTHLDALREIAG